jgi:DMSO reductase anchor subunit
MHPAYSVILFTTASGAGYGMLALLGLAGARHGPASSFAFGATAIVISLGLAVIGLLSSTFHLGRPERAWRAFSQWRTSWLSREGVAAVATFVPALLFAMAWTGILDAPKLIAPLGSATAIMCAITVFCTAKLYSTLRTIRAWHHPLTVPVYLVMALATGAPLLMAVAAVFGRWQAFQAILAIAAIVAAALLKFAYWRSIDFAKKTYTIEAATGLAPEGGKVRQWEVPHTSANFVMKEMGYAVARKHALKLRRICLVLLVLAAVFAALTMAALPVLFSCLSAFTALAATALERWLFFADAQHVVTLYYGAARA